MRPARNDLCYKGSGPVMFQTKRVFTRPSKFSSSKKTEKLAALDIVSNLVCRGSGGTRLPGPTWEPQLLSPSPILQNLSQHLIRGPRRVLPPDRPLGLPCDCDNLWIPFFSQVDQTSHILNLANPSSKFFPMPTPLLIFFQCQSVGNWGLDSEFFE